MTVREVTLALKKRYKEMNGERFFTEKALLSALFEKNGLDRNLPLVLPEMNLEEALLQALDADLAALLSGYPIQYYLGTEFFCGEEFVFTYSKMLDKVCQVFLRGKIDNNRPSFVRGQICTYSFFNTIKIHNYSLLICFYI